MVVSVGNYLYYPATYAVSGPRGFVKFDITRPVNWTGTPEGNPIRLGTLKGGRSRAIYYDADMGKIFVSCNPGYGVGLGGYMGVYDLKSEELTVYSMNDPDAHLQPNQTIRAFTSINGTLYVGTEIYGEWCRSILTPGSQAHLFAWDTETQEKLWDMIPVPGATHIGSLVTVNGLIYGMADCDDTRVIAFVVDPSNQKVIYAEEVSELTAAYNGNSNVYEAPAMLVGKDGFIYGATEKQLFQWDPETFEITVLLTWEYAGWYNQPMIYQDGHGRLYTLREGHIIRVKVCAGQ